MSNRRITRAESLDNTVNALNEMWDNYSPLMSRKELCRMIFTVSEKHHVRKAALEDVLPFISNGAHQPTTADAKELKARMKAKYAKKEKKEEQPTTAATTSLGLKETERVEIEPTTAEEVPTGVEFDGEMMSSLYLAQETGKRHSHVLRGIRNLLEQGVNETNFVLVDYTDAKGEKRPCYNLTKIGTLLLISGYDAVLREKIIYRWEALETGKAVSMAKMDTLDIMAMQIQELRNIRDKQAKIEARIDKIEADKEEAGKHLAHIPLAKESAPKRTERSLVVEITRAYALKYNVEFRKVMECLYKEFRYRFGIDLPKRAKGAHAPSTIAYAEQAGHIHNLYVLASEMFGHEQEQN